MVLHALLAASFALQNAEFAKYHLQITGREPMPGAVSFAVDPKVSASGRDAYTIKSVGDGARITGSNERSVWYGLYDLLERRGECHWFWDGDVVPKKPSLDLSGLDVAEEAHFMYRGLRYFAHRGLTRFQAEHWGLEDWKREIDWCLKRRMNVFMLRIGQDDLFQRAFPDLVRYPDAAKDLPGHGRGYDNRTLFWSLQFRGRLRADVQRYGRERGLMVPEDFGTMTHWYSRTPEEYLQTRRPPYLPQSTKGYSEPNGLVWDVRDDKWVDEYWKLTEAAVEAYGEGEGQRLLHTGGLGERCCYTNRADNLSLKIDCLKKFLKRAHKEYPNAKVLLAGWDFYFTWHPDEVRELLKTLDPRKDIIWDYEGDATRDFRPEMNGLCNNFSKWGVMGKFPYTYSVFLGFEDALDMRANYPLIEARQKLVWDDPYCAGYIFWPESSHTDTLLLRHYTANAWSKTPVPVADVLDEFCRSRYGDDAIRWKRVWERAMPVSWLLDWNGNYVKYAVMRVRFRPEYDEPKDDSSYWKARAARFRPVVEVYPEIIRMLSEIEWEGAFVRRDAIDLARMVLDRRIIAENAVMMDAFCRWRSGNVDGEEVVASARRYAALGAAMARLLALHTDFSLWESFERLNEVERVANPGFPQVLLENATCEYCASHQYEAAEHFYRPVMDATAARISEIVRSGRRTAEAPDDAIYGKLHGDFLKRPLRGMRPTAMRTKEAYRQVLSEALAAAVTPKPPVSREP